MQPWQLIQGDCLQVLATLPAESVQTCITSPPYWGLRDYGTAAWEGGDPVCSHRVPATGSTQNKGNNNREGTPFATVCGKCGATRIDNQLGLEATPEAYVASMVAVFREVRRVLRDDGTLWLNLGDSYYSSTATQGRNETKATGLANGWTGEKVGASSFVRRIPWLKPKDLVGIPWRVAFALQADGWYLRQDIIWHKPNPMPESVRDRCTKAHEYVFLLTKSERYFYDAEAVSEDGAWCGKQLGIVRGKKVRAESIGKKPSGNEKPGADALAPDRRNRRSVWTITTKPFSGAHFAVMPPDLVEPCIKAGCPEGGTVLDPFSGAATVGLVANQQGCRYVGVELNQEYCAMSVRRMESELSQPRLPGMEPQSVQRQAELWEEE